MLKYAIVLEKYSNPIHPNIPDEHIKVAFEENMKTAVGLASLAYDQNHLFSSLWLGQPEGSDHITSTELPFYVDDKNRAMLKEVYRLAHVDFDHILVYEHGDPSDRVLGYRYDRLLMPRQGNYGFVERFAVFPDVSSGSEKEWQRFDVGIHKIDSTTLRRFGLQTPEEP